MKNSTKKIILTALTLTVASCGNNITATYGPNPYESDPSDDLIINASMYRQADQDDTPLNMER